MIYIIDEDADALGAYAAELRLRGYGVHFLPSARAAFQTLWNAPLSEVELVIIDVMLAPGDDLGRQFGPDATADYTQTGLALIRDLSAQNPDVFPDRAVLFSSAVGVARRAATACAEALGIEFWDKHLFVSPMSFGDGVDRRTRRGTTHE